jgi:hypothetical protein
MQFQSPYAKAILGAILAALTALSTALADGHLTAAEVVGVLIAGIVTLGGVYIIPNSKPVGTAKHAVTDIVDTVLPDDPTPAS